MTKIRFAETSLKQPSAETLSFREKTELVRMIARLEPDVIELAPIVHEKADSLFVKAAADIAGDITLALSCPPEEAAILTAKEALKDAKNFRIGIEAPTSLVQMEYLSKTSPIHLIDDVKKSIETAKAYTDDVEFIAIDATRSERSFLIEILNAAKNAGAKTLTLKDSAGTLLPDEAAALMRDVLSEIPDADEITLAVSIDDTIHMADASSVYALYAGAKEVKAAVYPEGCASLSNIAELISTKGDTLKLESGIRSVELKRLTDQIAGLFTETRSKTSPFDSGVRESDNSRLFTAADDLASISKEAEVLGYALSEEDLLKVFEAFQALAEKKETVSQRELEALIASSSMEVPSTYLLKSCIINSVTSEDMLSSTAYIRLYKGDEVLESVAIGDGPIDAAFLAVEQITGVHYEVDDFQIRAVTEGREAMGETIVKLRNNGRVFSGRGLSTDIVQSGISAYISALNKIAYEEG